MRSNPIRFTGMASGMDTDSIVKDLMRPQQYRIDQEKKAQALLQLKQDAWKDMNKRLFDFHTKFTDKMRLASTFNKTTVTSSNESAMSINSDTQVPEGTHTFDITQLAESASAVGQVKKNEGLSEDPTLRELMGRLTVPKELAIKVNGEEIKIDVIETDTLSKIAEKMNEKLKDEKTGFTASYDKKNGGFFVSSTATGKDQTIEFSSNNAKGAKLFQRMGLEPGKRIPGKDAEYTYNEAEFTSSTNKIEINGIKATLKSA
ncbi:MAG TPA: hypothetical protein GX707_02010, partial [Epulopiscium sp.]|nr:hypothetical protein [Candidatus Epulonipiscium sp.]